MDGKNKFKMYLFISMLLLTLSSLYAMNYYDQRIKELTDHAQFIKDHAEYFIKSHMKQFDVAEEEARRFYNELMGNFERKIQKLFRKRDEVKNVKR